MTSVLDVQGAPLSVGNDSTERQAYAFMVPADAIGPSKTFWHVLLTATVTSRAILPGLFTLRWKFAGLSVAILAETLLVSASSTLVAMLYCWIEPGSPDQATLWGIVLQNAGVMVAPAGARNNALTGPVTLASDQLLEVTVQFDTADVANTFTRGRVVLQRFA